MDSAIGRWKLAARATAVVLAGGVAWAATDAVLAAGRSAGAHGGWQPCMPAAIALPFAVVLVGGGLWVAWRLWFRWNAATVRVAVVVALAGLWLTIVGRLAPADGSPWHDVAFNGLMLLGMIAVAAAYRRATAVVLRSAGLVDLAGRDGYTIGHAIRSQWFCAALGWQTWITARAAAGRPAGSVGLAVVVGPAVVGWATYRLARWRLVPPPPPAASPAGGFEVVAVGPEAGPVRA